MKTYFFHIILCICFITLFMRYQTNGQVALTDAFALINFVNQPSLSCFANSFANIAYKNDFFTKELSTKQIAISLLRKNDNLQCLMDHYGYSLYGQLRIGVGYGRRFGDYLSIVMRTYYILEHAKQYPSRHSLCFDVAFCYKITPKLWFSATVYNPFKLNYGIVGKNAIPMQIDIMTLYRISDNVSTNIFIQKQLPGGWEAGGGLHFKVVKPLTISLCCSNTNTNVYILLNIKNINVYLSTCWYYKINFSTQLGASYFINSIHLENPHNRTN